ncbi:hypothetical protein LOZ51_002242 [Ophidiomyces ophidiicola]|nr:hypothetical protein LOZ55_004778 [Ophidiomyces ophidiicola]KAI1980717.1 hypothetical protein LOZ54_005786 [Ophidiomyces ophidiicola]KAI1998511.1 hypothetical protein LOZ51_002242 [Ophidiomyces ophidiicola]
MVVLRLTVKIPPAEVAGKTASPPKSTTFMLPVYEPEKMKLGALAWRITEQWRKLCPDAPPLKIKKLLDDEYDGVELDLELTVADAFVDFGKARIDSCDQRATIRVVQEPAQEPLRYQSVAQDWNSAAEYYSKNARFAKTRPPVPLFACSQPSLANQKPPVQPGQVRASIEHYDLTRHSLSTEKPEKTSKRPVESVAISSKHSKQGATFRNEENKAEHTRSASNVKKYPKVAVEIKTASSQGAKMRVPPRNNINATSKRGRLSVTDRYLIESRQSDSSLTKRPRRSCPTDATHLSASDNDEPLPKRRNTTSRRNISAVKEQTEGLGLISRQGDDPDTESIQDLTTLFANSDEAEITEDIYTKNSKTSPIKDQSRKRSITNLQKNEVNQDYAKDISKPNVVDLTTTVPSSPDNQSCLRSPKSGQQSPSAGPSIPTPTTDIVTPSRKHKLNTRRSDSLKGSIDSEVVTHDGASHVPDRVHRMPLDDIAQEKLLERKLEKARERRCSMKEIDQRALLLGLTEQLHTTEQLGELPKVTRLQAQVKNAEVDLEKIMIEMGEEGVENEHNNDHPSSYRSPSPTLSSGYSPKEGDSKTPKDDTSGNQSPSANSLTASELKSNTKGRRSSASEDKSMRTASLDSKTNLTTKSIERSESSKSSLVANEIPDHDVPGSDISSRGASTPQRVPSQDINNPSSHSGSDSDQDIDLEKEQPTRNDQSSEPEYVAKGMSFANFGSDMSIDSDSDCHSHIYKSPNKPLPVEKTSVKTRTAFSTPFDKRNSTSLSLSQPVPATDNLTPEFVKASSSTKHRKTTRPTLKSLLEEQKPKGLEKGGAAPSKSAHPVKQPKTFLRQSLDTLSATAKRSFSRKL